MFALHHQRLGIERKQFAQRLAVLVDRWPRRGFGQGGRGLLPCETEHLLGFGAACALTIEAR